MLPVNPERKRVDDGRVILPSSIVPAWLKTGAVLELRVVPLIWRRPLNLPPPNRLDAWYLHERSMPSDGWQLDLLRLIDKEPDDDEMRRLRSLIYPAEIDTKTRSYRLGVSGLLSSLALKSDGSLWLVSEPDGSVSIWTDPGFQLTYAPFE